MSWLDKIDDLKREYGHKSRHIRFLRRNATPQVIEKLTAGFDDLWEIENDRIFPKVNEFPPGAQRILHPREKDHLSWLKVMRVNDRILSVPASGVEEEIPASIDNASAARRLTALWKIIRKSAEIEDEFINRHLSTLTRLVSQCPGAWLERNTHIAFRRLCMDLPVFIEAVERDLHAFRAFERDIVSLRRRPLQVRIIGVGEITTTIEITGDPSRGLRHPQRRKKITRAIKKMPDFPDFESANRYARLYDEYHLILKNHIGLRMPIWGSWIKAAPGKAVVYNWQERLPQESVAALVIHKVDDAANRRLFRLVMRELAKAFKYNRSEPETLIGLDGQIPNWSVVGFDVKRPEIRGDEALIYFDTSTPLMRRRLGVDKSAYGPDMLDTGLFLKSVPAPARPIIRLVALKEVVGRYYDPRKVITDLIASYYLYRRSDLVPVIVEDVNEFMRTELPEFGLKQFTVAEMVKYHKTDTMIWVFFRAMKRIDRWITEELLGKKYGQRLPRKKFTPGPYGDS